MKIKPLERSDHRNEFDCGTEALNDFLKKHSFQNQKNHILQGLWWNEFKIRRQRNIQYNITKPSQLPDWKNSNLSKIGKL